ncbi:MAG TPA: DUF1566 domain-containing protein [Nevskia sp.]|nr:DUF1566 domain-containing protein [Nevskia sp.]
MSNTVKHQPLRARNTQLVNLLNRWLGIDDWSDDLIAPADLVQATQAAVQGHHAAPPLLGSAAVTLISRFERKGGVVIDHVNGLEWQAQDDGVRRTWAEAKAYCDQLELAGGGWRLPTVAELNSLVDRTRREPAIDTALFPATQSDWYWTGEILAPRDASSPSVYAWNVYFSDGSVGYGGQDGSGFVRAVRRVPAGQ